MLVFSGCHNEIPLTRGAYNRNELSYHSGDKKLKIKVPAGLASKGSNREWQMATASLCAHVPFLGECGESRGHRSSLVFPPISTLILLDQGPILMTSFNLNFFLRGSISK